MRQRLAVGEGFLALGQPATHQLAQDGQLLRRAVSLPWMTRTQRRPWCRHSARKVASCWRASSVQSMQVQFSLDPRRPRRKSRNTLEARPLRGYCGSSPPSRRSQANLAVQALVQGGMFILDGLQRPGRRRAVCREQPGYSRVAERRRSSPLARRQHPGRAAGVPARCLRGARGWQSRFGPGGRPCVGKARATLQGGAAGGARAVGRVTRLSAGRGWVSLTAARKVVASSPGRRGRRADGQCRRVGETGGRCPGGLSRPPASPPSAGRWWV
jgi:hypothetical protein